MSQTPTEKQQKTGNPISEKTSFITNRGAQVVATAWLALVLFLFLWFRIWDSSTVTHWLHKLGGR